MGTLSLGRSPDIDAGIRESQAGQILVKISQTSLQLRACSIHSACHWSGTARNKIFTAVLKKRKKTALLPGISGSDKGGRTRTVLRVGKHDVNTEILSYAEKERQNKFFLDSFFFFLFFFFFFDTSLGRDSKARWMKVP